MWPPTSNGRAPTISFSTGSIRLYLLQPSSSEEILPVSSFCWVCRLCKCVETANCNSNWPYCNTSHITPPFSRSSAILAAQDVALTRYCIDRLLPYKQLTPEPVVSTQTVNPDHGVVSDPNSINIRSLQSTLLYISFQNICPHQVKATTQPCFLFEHDEFDTFIRNSKVPKPEELPFVFFRQTSVSIIIRNHGLNSADTETIRKEILDSITIGKWKHVDVQNYGYGEDKNKIIAAITNPCIVKIRGN